MSKKENLCTEITQRIIDEYIFNRDLTSSKKLLENLELLQDNGKAIRISGTDDVSRGYVSRYKVASKFITKFNKKLVNNRRIMLEYEYGNDKNLINDDPELRKLSECGLEAGTYFADVSNDKSDDYIILNIKNADKDDPYMISYELYFVGNRCLKFKDKFFKMYDKYQKISKSKKIEQIIYSDGSENKIVPFKPFDKVIFSGKEDIMKYIDNWVSNIPTYYSYGMTPKLSVLLYGKPGTGKSTFAKALANYLDISNILSITPSYFNDSQEVGNNYNRRLSPTLEAVQVIDDIDCVCKSREESEEKENLMVLSNLLSYLDNPRTFFYKANDGIYYPISIVVATTNYYDRLDDAVKRYGRFDLKIEMKDFTIKEANDMCKLYDLSLSDVLKEPIKDEKAFTISPAYLQALCLENVDKSLKTV